MNTSAVTERRDLSPQSQDESVRLFLMINTLETGGTERQFVTMAKALQEDFAVHLGCLKRIGPFSSELLDLDEFSPCGSLLGTKSWRARLGLSRTLRAEQIEIAHAFDFYSNLMLIPAARFAGVPVILGSHRQLGDLLTRSQFRAQNLTFRLCDRVVCNSKAAADRLRQAGVPSKKLVVIPNALREDCFSDKDPALPRSGGLRVGMVSRMNDPIKRHDLFLRTAARLAPEFPNLEFVLVGDGPLRPGLEQLASQLGLKNKVIFLGDRRDVTAILASLDVSVLPSGSESLSNVILESMAAAVPVLASDVGGNTELIESEKCGLLFSSGDEAAFSRELTRLLKNAELRKTLRHNAREKAQACYSIAAIRQQYQRLYRQLLAEKRRGTSAVTMAQTESAKERPFR